MENLPARLRMVGLLLTALFVLMACGGGGGAGDTAQTGGTSAGTASANG